ncbi:immunoglobulin-like domain-containing receptor 2 [Leptodactylus fuscus]|uniref:immunoglobulin-like domain-containing receptor 2 n=1 Tax=Leptodactylus fuscus TaxID=238119 RepID=UPI003F4E7B42
MPDHKKSVMLFQSTLLRCHYSTTSSQPVLVQWKYKSFCQDRTEEALGIGKAPNKANMGGNQYLDCADGSRTVRPVASKLGDSVTLGDFYKGRPVTIVNDADLQFGTVQWGDSGLYYCLVAVSDDLEGKNEDRVEVLVMGEYDNPERTVGNKCLIVGPPVVKKVQSAAGSPVFMEKKHFKSAKDS